MFRSLSSLALSSVYLISLTACATTPKTETLMSGISATDAAQTYPAGQMRQASDPVCVNFYNNVKTYIAQSNKPNRGKSFLTSVGVGVLASVATRGIGVGGIDSTVGQIVAQQTVSTAVYQGSAMAIKGLKKNSAGGAKIIKASEELHCPVNFAP